MTKLINIKRATANQMVKSDVTGFGEWVTGKITAWDKNTITYQPADGTEEVTVARSLAYKATEEELAAQTPREDLFSGEDLEEDLEDEENLPLRKIKKYAQKYEPCIAASGKKSKDNGDEVAHKLRGLELEEVYTLVAEETGLDFEDLINRYAHLNDGHQRMCLGNRLRGHYRRLEDEG